ncbi:HAD-superfamily subfamily IB hydrolase, TIGR01490 [Geosporobacter subterraneus DSM 17957]|uniref:phosphoserine phosphatase n=1 Tax=Geosporobacter subterraneus DSM 17957 TaxID=1121919 RepID=A0A1M6NUH1_9FIRM|nr:HAD-IB family hydrolase [Geosporobacter subterraneus]SHJ99353.1 HAD-superfamily subfamily IB hydrolase, TIGR01490 [Geosporobacter subterraneus DSM 17957]
MKTIAAFFDIDGTLYRDSLMVEHFKKLMKYEVIDATLWHRNAKQTYQNWDKRQGNYDDYLLEIANIYIESMKGLNSQQMEFITNQVISQKGDRVYRYTRARIAWHKCHNHKILFISGSPSYLVSKMAKKYEVEDYRGTEYLTDENGNYTGEIIQMWDSSNKQKAILDFVEQYNIDLESSYSYGDTNGDLSMLAMVGHPIAINPTKELLQNIQLDPKLRKKALIVVERKDVIYKLNADVEFL